MFATRNYNQYLFLPPSVSFLSRAKYFTSLWAIFRREGKCFNFASRVSGYIIAVSARANISMF